MTPVFLVISAPSGAGKTTVSQGLLAANPGLRRVITCTTRAPRAGEQDGVDYHFLDPATFERRIAAGEFIEHANVYGNRYGTLKASVLELLRAQLDVILSVDVQGVRAIRQAAAADPELGASLVTAFLTPATLTELSERLRGRGSDAPDVVARRLSFARSEIEEWPGFDYLVVSGTRADDQQRMQSILDAERLRARRATFTLQP